MTAGANPTLAQRLGYPAGQRLLLINADDAGMCQAGNTGVLRALRAGLVRSCTVMAPCPWFADFAARIRRDPSLNLGVHLTVTSEWHHYRWGPLSARAQVPSLVDEQGRFFRTEDEVCARADPVELEREFIAQIECVLAAGLKPTHLDAHMGVYHLRDDFFAIAKRLAEHYRLTLRVAAPERVERLQAEGWAVADHFFFQTHDVPLEQRRRLYLEIFDQLPEGVTELVIHPAEPTEELRAIGGMWQRRGFDLEFFENPETADRLAEAGIEPIGYAELQALTSRALGWSGP